MSEPRVVDGEVADGTVHVGSLELFDDTDRVLVSVENREIAVYSTDEGIYALSNYCVHQGGPMCEGLLSGTVSADEDGELDYDLENRVVSCPWHGWEFDVRDGRHLSNAAYRLPSYAVAVEDGEVYLEL